MLSIMYTDSPLVITGGILTGAVTYFITDQDYYRVSEFIHYSSIIGGLYFVYEMFIPGSFFLGFHIAYHLEYVY